MSLLLKEITRIDKQAADVLKGEDLKTDAEIQTLTREDLHELFPESKNFKRRRTIFDIIHKQKPVEVLLKNLKDFIPHESFRAALTNNGVLVDYLRILKDIQAEVKNVQKFIDTHVGFLEEFSKNPPDQESANMEGQPYGLQKEAQGSCTSDAFGPKLPQIGPTGGHPQEQESQSTLQTLWSYLPSLSSSDTSEAGGQMVLSPGPTEGHSQGTKCPSPSASSSPVKLHSGAQGTSEANGQMVLSTGPTEGHSQGTKSTLTYKMVVSGKTFEQHLVLMDKVKKQVANQFRLCEDNWDNKITFVFCPISSRIASDVEAALTDFKVSSGDKPIILVLMHHAHGVKCTPSFRTWHDDAKVVLHVNVFYHETTGLLKCEENNAAVTEIANKLQESFFPRSKDTSGNAQGVGAATGVTGRSSSRGDGNHRGSKVGNRYFSNMFGGNNK
ncbi:uncharacterized protein LOC129107312 isoform X2 [Anoplopoma fimbria]|nr:uncharacterized protein LOC129107312 isoform X2 [Anoplopoma fimbria]